MTYESITEEMIQALDDEIDAIKKGAGDNRLALNILSHSHTTEQMIRLDNPRLTTAFLDFNGITGALNREKRRKRGFTETYFSNSGEKYELAKVPQSKMRAANGTEDWQIRSLFWVPGLSALQRDCKCTKASA
ncbi:MAG: hypothetical protein HPY52_09850 [Firmicutes bacterium]|nr:hypothetical protein [Bacillota bacterium]